MLLHGFPPSQDGTVRHGLLADILSGRLDFLPLSMSITKDRNQLFDFVFPMG